MNGEARFGNCIVGLRKNRFMAMWEVTKRCNLRCAYCCLGQSRGRIQGELNTNDSLAVVARLRALGVTSLYITGGEPFSRPDISTILEGTSIFDNVSIATNGLLLSHRHVPVLNALHGLEYVAVGFDNIYVDGARWSEEEQRKSTCIEILRDANVPVRVGLPIWAQEIDEKKVAALSRFCRSHDILQLHFRFVEGVGGVDPGTVVPTGHQRARISRALADQCARLGVTAVFAGDLLASPEHDTLEDCPGGSEMVFVDNGGFAYPCSWLAKVSSTANFGSILDESFRVGVGRFRRKTKALPEGDGMRTCPARQLLLKRLGTG